MHVHILNVYMQIKTVLAMEAQPSTQGRRGTIGSTAAPGTSFVAMAAAWQQQLNELNAGTQPQLRRIIIPMVSRSTSTSDDGDSDSDLPGTPASSAGRSEAGNAAMSHVAFSDLPDSGDGSNAASSMECMPTAESTDQLRAPAMVHPADAAAVEAALTSGLFLETRQPPWRGAGRQVASALTILVRSAAPLAAEDQSLVTYQAALRNYASPAADAADSRIITGMHLRAADGGSSSDGDGEEDAEAAARAALYASIKVIDSLICITSQAQLSMCICHFSGPRPYERS